MADIVNENGLNFCRECGVRVNQEHERCDCYAEESKSERIHCEKCGVQIIGELSVCKCTTYTREDFDWTEGETTQGATGRGRGKRKKRKQKGRQVPLSRPLSPTSRQRRNAELRLEAEECKTEVHQRALENRGKGTIASYGPVQKEFIQWCERKGYNNHTVSAEKLLVFLMHDVVDRPVRQGKKNNAGEGGESNVGKSCICW